AEAAAVRRGTGRPNANSGEGEARPGSRKARKRSKGSAFAPERVIGISARLKTSVLTPLGGPGGGLLLFFALQGGSPGDALRGPHVRSGRRFLRGGEHRSPRLHRFDGLVGLHLAGSQPFAEAQNLVVDLIPEGLCRLGRDRARTHLGKFGQCACVGRV